MKRHIKELTSHYGQTDDYFLAASNRDSCTHPLKAAAALWKWLAVIAASRHANYTHAHGNKCTVIKLLYRPLPKLRNIGHTRRKNYIKIWLYTTIRKIEMSHRTEPKNTVKQYYTTVSQLYSNAVLYITLKINIDNIGTPYISL